MLSNAKQSQPLLAIKNFSGTRLAVYKCIVNHLSFLVYFLKTTFETENMAKYVHKKILKAGEKRKND